MEPTSRDTTKRQSPSQNTKPESEAESAPVVPTNQKKKNHERIQRQKSFHVQIKKNKKILRWVIKCTAVYVESTQNPICVVERMGENHVIFANYKKAWGRNHLIFEKRSMGL
jgi:hypothetical protein